MSTALKQLADEIAGMLEEFPMVRKCTIAGSLAKGTADEQSVLPLRQVHVPHLSVV